MKRLLALAVTLALLPQFGTGSAAARSYGGGCHSRSCIERVARKKCARGNVHSCIHRAALHWRQPLGDALRVAGCESGFDPRNSYLGHLGLYQFLFPSTWQTTPYAQHDVYSAKWSALAAMWMWHVGRRGEWACQ